MHIRHILTVGFLMLAAGTEGGQHRWPQQPTNPTGNGTGATYRHFSESGHRWSM